MFPDKKPTETTVNERKRHKLSRAEAAAEFQAKVDGIFEITLVAALGDSQGQ